MALISGAAEFQKQLAVATDDTAGFSVSYSQSLSPTIEVGVGAPLPVSQYSRASTGVTTTVGDATHSGFHALVNPVGSGVLFVIEKAVFTCNAATQFAAAISSDAAGDGVGVSFQATQLEGRLPFRSGLWVQSVGVITPPFTSSNLVERGGAGIALSTPLVMLPIVLAPNQAYVIWPLGNTLTFNVAIYFRVHEQRPT